MKEGACFLDFHSFIPSLLNNLSYTLVVFCSVLVVQLCGVCVGRTFCVGVVQQRLDASEHRANVVLRTPIVLQDIQTYISICVN